MKKAREIVQGVPGASAAVPLPANCQPTPRCATHQPVPDSVSPMTARGQRILFSLAIPSFQFPAFRSSGRPGNGGPRVVECDLHQRRVSDNRAAIDVCAIPRNGHVNITPASESSPATIAIGRLGPFLDRLLRSASRELIFLLESRSRDLSELLDLEQRDQRIASARSACFRCGGDGGSTRDQKRRRRQSHHAVASVPSLEITYLVFRAPGAKAKHAEVYASSISGWWPAD